MGDLADLAESIRQVGLLRPIGITQNGRLVFGERRLRACRDILDWTGIPATVIDIASIADGAVAGDDLRKQFTASERVAILDALEAGAGGLDRNEAARRVGFSSHDQAHCVRTVVRHAAPAVVDAMDRGELSPAAAAKVARSALHGRRAERAGTDLAREARPAPDGRAANAPRRSRPSPSEANRIARETGTAVLGSDNRYHNGLTPAEQASADERMRLQFRIIDSLAALATFPLDADAAADLFDFPQLRDAVRENWPAAMRFVAAFEQAMERRWTDGKVGSDKAA